MSYPSIRIEGSILTGDILDKLEQGDLKGQKSRDFGFVDALSVKNEIVNAWADARDLWRMFRRRAESLPENDRGTTVTRNQWMIPFLSLLRYTPEYQAKGETVDGKNFAISHRDMLRDGFPIHINGFRDSLDRRRLDSGPRVSPHALVQEYLNLTEHLYAIITNGLLIRLLRDSTRLVKLSYLEFDLDRMFEEQHFLDFAVMYRLLHVTRMPATRDASAESLIEMYHQDALDSGSRIREGLSRAVESSIITFADGFLNHPANDLLRQRVTDGSLTPGALYHLMLRLIYRLLFLMVIEERNLVVPDGSDPVLRDIYTQYYSVGRLRKLAGKRHLLQARFDDYWPALRNTFRLFESGDMGAPLGLRPLAGDLFGPDALGILDDCRLDNATVMECLTNLSIFENPQTRQRMRINYAALNVEEFGSVYEGLLEYDPDITRQTDRFRFRFVKGDSRAASGTHYTPDELVIPLVKNSLDYVIKEKLGVVSGEIGNRGKNGKDKLIQGFEGMENGDGSGAGVLWVDRKISERGDVRVNITDPKGGKLDSGEHRRGMGPGVNQRVYPISAHRPGQSEGIGNPSSLERAAEFSHRGSDTGVNDPDRTTRQNDPHSHPNSGTQNLTSPPHSPLTIPHSQLLSKALLSIRVCDPACGSGHILLSAARRIATELACIRTGEEQPSPPAFREAVRDVIRNCIYGVDINPLAVELCKVAMWLEAHNPGEPLNFLDHHIKCGDAVVGLAHREELEAGIPVEAFDKVEGDDPEVASSFRKTNREDRNRHREGSLFGDPVAVRLKEALRRFEMIAGMPETTPAEIDAKKAAYQEFETSPQQLELHILSSLPVAQFFIPKTDANRRELVTDEMFRQYQRGEMPLQGQGPARAYAESINRRFFHWFLEFPQVFAEGGFDCILGNPPFLGGQKLSGTFGKEYPQYLKYQYAPIGSCDLVTYFFRRIFTLLRPGGFQSLLATNTVAQGGAREGGLDVIRDQGGTIMHAVRSMPWPGAAAVEVALVTIFKGKWEQEFMLNRRVVERITTYLDDDEYLGDPYPLKRNAGKSFQGSIVLGKGFVLEPEEAQRLIERDPQNRDVLYPYLNGDDVNSRPDQSPSRWVINFHDWPLDEEWDRKQRVPKGRPYAVDYPDCLEIVRRLVKPERDILLNSKDSTARECAKRWWQFRRPTINLYRSIEGLERVLVIAQTSHTGALCFVPNGYVYSMMCIVFRIESLAEFAVLQSCFHFEWAWKYCSTMKGDLRYTPSTIFENFPCPRFNEDENERLRKIGNMFFEMRNDFMKKADCGLTKTYNQIHNQQLPSEPVSSNPPMNKGMVKDFGKQTVILWNQLNSTPGTCSFDEAVQGIIRLRELQKEMDNAVLAAYGWDRDSVDGPAIDLAHDFYEVEYLPETDRVRYTISPEARKEVLKRLLKLNHRIREEEASREWG